MKNSRLMVNGSSLNRLMMKGGSLNNRMSRKLRQSSSMTVMGKGNQEMIHGSLLMRASKYKTWIAKRILQSMCYLPLLGKGP